MTFSQLGLFIRTFGVERFKIIEGPQPGILTFRINDTLPLHFFVELNDSRPLGIQYMFEPLGFFECRIEKQQFVSKYK